MILKQRGLHEHGGWNLKVLMSFRRAQKGLPVPPIKIYMFVIVHLLSFAQFQLLKGIRVSNCFCTSIWALKVKFES